MKVTTTRPLRAIQQIQLGTVLKNQTQARATLRLLREAAYEGIELNGFMIRPTPLVVRALTRLAGMPAGKGGRLDWPALVREAGLEVVAVHEDLGGIERDPAAVVAQARSLGTGDVVITGTYRFDHSDEATVRGLAGRLNAAGRRLADDGLRLLYHNHNAEFRRVASGATAYDLIIDQTDPELLGFELDCYWPTVAGVDPVRLMSRLGDRLAMIHLTDRGPKVRGRSLTPIVPFDTVELGFGTMDLARIVEAAKAAGVRAVILETHRNWAGGSPVRSFQLSAPFMAAHV